MSGDLQIQRLELRTLTTEAFSPYGTYAEAPTAEPDWIVSGDRINGVVEDTQPRGRGVSKLWKLGDLSFDTPPYLGHVRYQFQGFRVAQLERHRGETQTWLSVAESSVVVVALGDAGSPIPQLDTAAAFLVQPGALISIGRAVWHCHFLPLGRYADFTVITARREPEQDRDLVDLGQEIGLALEVTLGGPLPHERTRA